ncbi:MAG TPA: HlyD family type I secretion periplasmic adaptor subunit [Desulfobulbaceae bacterium]|nr:HlyD family type I secretion periplasmic adaptor subunit [Desulfobulbaceae bacterium]
MTTNSVPPSGRNIGTVHLFFALLTSACLGFVIWAAVGRLDIVSTANGKVVPSSQVKHIQHLEGGIVSEIKVHEGEAVREGQILAVLEQIASGADVDELQARIVSLSFDVIRLEAENETRETLVFPAELVAAHPDLAQQQIHLFQARQSQYQSEIAAQQEQIRQKEQDSKVIRARLESSRAALALLQKQLDISEQLLAESLTTQYKHLELKREATELDSSIGQDRAAIERAESTVKEARRKLEETQHGFLSLVRKELKEARGQLEELTSRIRKYDDSLQRGVIRSPVNGIIKTLHIVTEGGVVTPGMTIMDIVPAGDRLVIEAHLPISDIGFVGKGQRAVIQIASPDARRFGKLEGTVTHVSPDAFTTDEGKMYYTVRIDTDQDRFAKNNHEYRLYPGVLVQVFIHIGQRSVLAYLLDPFLVTLDNSLQER